MLHCCPSWQAVHRTPLSSVEHTTQIHHHISCDKVNVKMWISQANLPRAGTFRPQQLLRTASTNATRVRVLSDLPPAVSHSSYLCICSATATLIGEILHDGRYESRTKSHTIVVPSRGPKIPNFDREYLDNKSRCRSDTCQIGHNIGLTTAFQKCITWDGSPTGESPIFCQGTCQSS